MARPKKYSGKRQYSEEDKAVCLAALDAYGGNLLAASRTLGIPRKTLAYWAGGGAVNPAVAEVRHIKKAELADRLEEIAHNLAEAIPGKIEDATLQQVAVSLGIAVDKMLLLRGQPTEIIDEASLTDDQRADRIAEILHAARSRRKEGAAASFLSPLATMQ